MSRITRFVLLTVLGLAFVASASAQWDKKPYTEWSEKEATKILNESPWGQTQTATDTSNMTGQARVDSGRSRISDVVNVNFRIRFFSARPVRQAFSRIVELQQQGEVSDQLAARLKGLANGEFPDFVIITVSCDSLNASQQFQRLNAALSKQTTAELQQNTYLQAKGGQRIFLREYQAPRNDGFGARFVFPRLVDGKPWLTPESGEVLFNSELKEIGTLSMRYKVKDMMFNGKLEY